MLSEVSADEDDMHFIFKTRRQLLGAKTSISPRSPSGLRPWTPLGTSVPLSLICSPLTKIPARAHAS